MTSTVASVSWNGPPQPQPPPRGSQTARERSTTPRPAPPPPLPRAALQLPRPQPLTSESERLAQLRRAVQPAQSSDSRAISHWLHRAVGSAPLSDVSRQVEELFWPPHHSHDEHKQQMMHSEYRSGSMPPILSARSSSAAATPLIPDPHSLPYLRSEIDLLRRQTQAHLVKDLAYDDLILENRALKSQLGLVKEMEHKIAELKAMAEEKEQRRKQQIEAMSGEYDTLSTKYEATLQELVQSQSLCKMQAKQNGQLIGTMGEAGIALEDLRSKLGATTTALEELQSTRHTAASELEIATSQLDALRTAHGHLKSELESRVEEVSTLHRMREMQTEQLATLRAAAVEASAKIAVLERDNEGLSSVVALRAELVDSQSSLSLSHTSISRLQTRVDSLEALLEHHRHHARNGWVPPELQDDVDVTELIKQLRGNNDEATGAGDEANPLDSDDAKQSDETASLDPDAAIATTAIASDAASSAALVAPSLSAAPAPSARPTKNIASAAVSTALSRKLEKCLTDSLRDNSALVAAVAALKLTNKSLVHREGMASQRVGALQTLQAQLQARFEQSQRDCQSLEHALDRKSRRVLDLQSELADAENVLNARQDVLRKTQAELSSVKAANQSLEAASKLDASRLERDLKAMQSRFAVEVAAHDISQKDMETMRADHAALLNQHGLTLQAKESLSANFARTVATNGELSVRLAVAEASAARTQQADDRAAAAERALEQSNATLARLSGEVETLQQSLQSLSESHTDLTASLHKSQSKAAALSLDNAKAHTRISNLVHQIASEEHAKSSSAGQVKMMEMECAAAKEQLSALETKMLDEQKAAAATLDSYRSARKECVSAKSKLSASLKAESQARAALDKEVAKNKRLEVEMSRLRQVAIVASASSSSSRPATASQDELPLARAHSQSRRPSVSSGGASSSMLPIPAEIACFESSPAARDDDASASASVQADADDHSSGLGSPSLAEGSPTRSGSPLELFRRMSPSRSPSLQSLSDRGATPPPLAHSVLLAVPVAPLELRALTPEEAAIAESARKREEERRIKRRVPKQRAHAATTAVPTTSPAVASASVAPPVRAAVSTPPSSIVDSTRPIKHNSAKSGKSVSSSSSARSTAMTSAK